MLKLTNNMVFSIFLIFIMGLVSSYFWFPSIMIIPFMLGSMFRSKDKTLNSVFSGIPRKELFGIIVMALVGSLMVLNDSFYSAFFGFFTYSSLLVCLYVVYFSFVSKT